MRLSPKVRSNGDSPCLPQTGSRVSSTVEGDPVPESLSGQRVTRSSASARPTVGRSNRGAKSALCCPRAPRIWETRRGDPIRPLRARFCLRPRLPPRPAPASGPPPSPHWAQFKQASLGSLALTNGRRHLRRRARRGAGRAQGSRRALCRLRRPPEMRSLASAQGAHHKGGDTPRALQPPPRVSTGCPPSAPCFPRRVPRFPPRPVPRPLFPRSLRGRPRLASRARDLSPCLQAACRAKAPPEAEVSPQKWGRSGSGRDREGATPTDPSELPCLFRGSKVGSLDLPLRRFFTLAGFKFRFGQAASRCTALSAFK